VPLWEDSLCQHLSMEAVLIAGNEDQKRRFCKPMLDAGIGAFALTEPRPAPMPVPAWQPR